jgi:hypothetical protein
MQRGKRISPLLLSSFGRAVNQASIFSQVRIIVVPDRRGSERADCFAKLSAADAMSARIGKVAEGVEAID